MKRFSIFKFSAFCAILSFIMTFGFINNVLGGVIVSVPQQVKPSVIEAPVKDSFLSIKPVSQEHQRERSHAPEPSTIFLFMSGVVGMIVHAARRCFRAAKRVMDYVLAGIAVILAAPVFVLIAILVKLTSQGPALYRQARVGKDGKVFQIMKFRSMSVDAEKGTGAVWAKKNDPRVTPLGSILRKTHLDELPQLFNVLKGEMSIVGPRPERPEIVKDLKRVIVDYEKRLQVLPGITGLAQIVHRYDENIKDVRKKVKYDLLYIKKMCWLAEMRIMASTCVMMLTGKVIR